MGERSKKDFEGLNNMKIKTKFNLGDIVYFNRVGEIIKGRISVISIHEYNTSSPPYKIIYSATVNEELIPFPLFEREVFTSEKELLKQL